MSGFETVNLVAMSLTIICELLLLAFIFFIGRFYEMKFRQQTHSIWFLLPMATFVISMLALLFVPEAFYIAALVSNFIILAVLAKFGFTLYSLMLGVYK
jgi:hypothetical protein